MTPRCPGYQGVIFLLFRLFSKLQAIDTDFKATTYQKIAKIYSLLYILFHSCFKIFPNFIISVATASVLDAWEWFKNLNNSVKNC